MINYGCISSEDKTKGNNQENDEKIINQKVNFSDSATIFYKDSIIYKTPKDKVYQTTGVNLFKEGTLKIITNIDGNCGACIHKLNQWRKLIKKAKNIDKLNIIFFIITEDFDFFHNELYPKIQDIRYPIVLDKKYAFLKKNNLPQHIKYHTLLLDTNNRIIITGNPIYNDELMELYREEINKRIN
ncbi:MAG: hypothetical protein ACOC4L_04230 [Halanaerobium sp.]